MNYNLSRLGPIEFEDMVQSLWEGYLGITSSIYGSGPDGQREATFQGKATVPNENGEELDGYWVLQAKFKEKDDNKDFNWLKSKINEEMQGFQKKKEENEKEGREIHKIPEIYLFVTNIVLSSVERTGLKDKIMRYIEDKDYPSIIPYIYVLGYDEIARMLDSNRDVATAYASFIMSGDILTCLYDSVTEKEKLRHDSLLRYIKNSFINNRRSRMDQQEEIEEAEGRKVYLEKVYTDLDYSGENLSGKFVKDALAIGDKMFRPQSVQELRVLKEAAGSENIDKRFDHLKHFNGVGRSFKQEDQPFSSNKYIVKGSAGQGKSTVCQFLAQIYRASFLKEFWIKIDEPDNGDGYGAFLETIKEKNYKLPSCRRIPIFLDLKSYASWIYQKRDDTDKESCDLVSYIVSQISNGANDNKFDSDTLRLYFKTFSWIFFFDGLDEVPESSNRDQVLREINYFINVELEQANTDAVFFATTRPEGFVGNEFETVRFQQVQLLLLKDEDCYTYLENLLTLLRGEERAREPLQILKGYLRGRSSDMQIKKMLRTPLQARIIALLVMNNGELPQDKYTLFQEYFNIIIKREKSKKVENMIHIFSKYEKQIKPLFYILGYTLQNKSAQIGEDAFITKDELLGLICKRLREKEFSDSEIEKDASLVCKLISERLNIAEEIRAGYIGFPIRSLQEYLTAKYLIVTANGDSRKWSKALKKMAVSSYWQNTFFLFLEGLQQETDDYLTAQINDLLTGLNAGYTDRNGFDMISYGSQTALTLLHNHILNGSPDYEIRLFNILNNGLQNLMPSEELKYISNISMRIKIMWVNEIIQRREAFLTEMDFAAMSILLKDMDRYPQDLKNNVQEFIKNHTREIVISCVDTFSIVPPWMISYVVTLINEGCILSIDSFCLDDILDAVKNSMEENSSLTKQGKDALFKIAIKSYIKQGSWFYADELFKQVFGWDFDPLSRLMSNSFEMHEIGFNVKWFYMFPVKVTENELKPLADLAQQYGLRGLTLILHTICSDSLAYYKKFAEEILSYKDEIFEYGEERLIKQNKLMLRIWCAQCYGWKYSFSMEELLDERSEIWKETAKSLKTLPVISTWEDFVRVNQNGFSLLSIRCNKDITFLDIYNETLKHVSQGSILSYNNLCSYVSFFYAASLQSAYINYKNDSDMHDFQECINESMQFFKTILKFSSKCAVMYDPWTDVLWQFAFLLIKTPKTWTEFQDFKFYEMQSLRTATGYEIKFLNKDSATIINGAIDYIRHTENASAYSFLHNFVSQEDVDYQCLEMVDWSRLDSMWTIEGQEEKKLQCLAKVVQANDRAQIENMLKLDGEVNALLQDDMTFDFIWQVLSEKKIPSKLIPLLVYYLDAYRKKLDNTILDKRNIKNRIRFLEKKIKDILTAQPINL